MTDSYDDVLKQIEKLQVKAAELRSNEERVVIASIRANIEKYKLTAADIGFDGIKVRPKKQITKSKTVRYRNDTNADETYGGKGPKPIWLKEKLNQGRTMKEFEVV